MTLRTRNEISLKHCIPRNQNNNNKSLDCINTGFVVSGTHWKQDDKIIG